MAWSFLSNGSASGTSDTLFPGGPFAQQSGAHLGYGPAGVSSGAIAIVPDISFPELNLTESEREATKLTFGQWELGMPLEWHNELYEDYTGVVNKSTGKIVTSGTKVYTFHRLLESEKSNGDIHGALKRMKAKYSDTAVRFGATQTGGLQAFVSPSGGTQVIFPGQSSSGVV
jgi:hypothetical protein